MFLSDHAHKNTRRHPQKYFGRPDLESWLTPCWHLCINGWTWPKPLQGNWFQHWSVTTLKKDDVSNAVESATESAICSKRCAKKGARPHGTNENHPESHALVLVENRMASFVFFQRPSFESSNETLAHKRRDNIFSKFHASKGYRPEWAQWWSNAYTEYGIL